MLSPTQVPHSKNSNPTNLRFTCTVSKSSVNFLDLTIYKGPDFHQTHRLDLKTFQKPQDLYQYLDFTSAHPQHVYRSIVLGECARYLRSNTRKDTYLATTAVFQKRLQARNYPKKLTRKLISRIDFSNRTQYLQTLHRQTRNHTPIPPIFKCYPPPRFHTLKTVILQQYHTISHLVPTPRFVTLSHQTLRNLLVRAEVKPTSDQSLNLLQTLKDLPQNTPHATTSTSTVKETSCFD